MVLDLVFVQLNFKRLIVARHFLSNSEIFLQLFLTYQLLNSLYTFLKNDSCKSVN